MNSWEVKRLASLGTSGATIEQAAEHAGQPFLLSDIVAAMTYALDITEGQPEGHTLRACLIGMRIGQSLGLDVQQSSDLYYGLLLKDLGCSSNAAKIHHLFGADDFRIKRSVKTINFDKLSQGAGFVLGNAGSAAPLQRRLRHIIDVSLGKGGGHGALTQIRCERGADIALQMGFSESTARAIRALDEHWDGNGHPYGLAAQEIPLLGQILCLAQTIEVFFQEAGPEVTLKVVKERAGTWFNPLLVDIFETTQRNAFFWSDLLELGLEEKVASLEPQEHRLRATDSQLDQVAEAFARVIDAKSPWTFKHSERVRQLALGAARQLHGDDAFSPERIKRLSRAALLHDIGKLGVSNTILDKPGRLSDQEFAAIRRHPAHSEQILRRVKPFEDLAQLAGGHHERMDGKGYHSAIPAGVLDLEVRLLVVADQFEALTAARPYREGLSPEAALALIARDVGEGVDPLALKALEAFLSTAEAQQVLLPQGFDPEIPIPGSD